MSEINLNDARKSLAAIRAKAKPKYSSKTLVRLGEKRYAEIKERLEAQNNNQFVVIEVDSGDYFIDKNHRNAVLKARKKYPTEIFYLARIGSRAAFSMKGNVPLLCLCWTTGF